MKLDEMHSMREKGDKIGNMMTRDQRGEEEGEN